MHLSISLNMSETNEPFLFTWSNMPDKCELAISMEVIDTFLSSQAKTKTI